MNTIERIARDLWPHHKKYLVRRALAAHDGQTIRLSIGEAETLATREVEREVRQRLENNSKNLVF
jgi:hypothetical protein